MRIEQLTRFESVVAQYQRDIVNFQYRLVGNRFEAEDLAQETFIKAYKKLHTLKDQEKIKSWLFSIARNVSVDFFRRNAERAIPLDSIILENYARATAIDQREQVEYNDMASELKGYIEKLNVEDRLIIKLLYYEGFSYKEIGTLLKMNENTLKSRLHRARKTLFDLIQSNRLLHKSSVGVI
jgi:RNA polymerase sigma-70 factor, ECF subfamily